MPNVLKMELQESIKVLHRKGWSHRRIASELGVNRRTVKRYCCDSKCTNPQTGSGTQSTPTRNPRTHAPLSACEPHRGQIAQWYESGLSIERIHSDLNALGFEGSYHSVYRFLKNLEVDEVKRIYRMEYEPGQEGQIDGTVYLPVGGERP